MKRSKIIFWTATVFLFLFEGAMPLATLLLAPEFATAGVVYLGFPTYFAYALIAFKVLGSLALVIPSLPRTVKEWAYAGFAFNFICATISHMAIDGLAFVSFFPLIIMAIAAISYVYYLRIFHPGSAKQTAPLSYAGRLGVNAV